MALRNSTDSYGGVARVFHWLTAALILTAIPLGLFAVNLPTGTEAEVARAMLVYSLHKTVGVAAFLVALARILWALTQARPVPLHPGRRVETLVAEGVHWTLYASLLVVPLAGWVKHAALDGFAPILWPLGQGLPLVPRSEVVAEVAGQVHWAFGWVLMGALALHVAGAVKHALIDRDGTLARMVTGRAAGGGAAHGRWVAPVVALAVYALALGGTAAMSLQEQRVAAVVPVVAEAAPQAGALPLWQVQDGSIGLSVRQSGAAVQGSLPGWQAEIRFAETAVDGSYGSVRVVIPTGQLTLGSVTSQAKGSDFFDVATHPQAVFEAVIAPAAEGWAATGTLTLRGVTVPVALPFTLDIAGDTATARGTVTLDRRDFGMGAAMRDETTVGFGVEVTVEVTAVRAG